MAVKKEKQESRKIRNTKSYPITYSLNEYGEKKVKRSVTFIPSSVTLEKDLGPGVIRVSVEDWERIKAEGRLQGIGRDLLEV